MIDPERLCKKCMTTLAAADAACPNCGTFNCDVSNLPHQLGCGVILAGKYWLGSVLGQGGFGITYIGFDLNLGIKVAIKEYYPNNIVSRNQFELAVLPVHEAFLPAFARGRERFLEEARAIARFSSEHGVVNVREFFLENNTAYIVMDYVDGKTLKAVANEAGGKLPSRRVLSMLRPLIRTLARIHAAGLVHRDISPDNIILQPDGTAVLIDFGAARQISATGSKSLTINVKHGYAPEEQYRRRGKQGPWTDVYALCATIYRLTTGKKPPQALDRLVADDPLISPNERGADFTSAQQWAILKGLSVRAEDRPQDMRALFELLYNGENDVGGWLQRILKGTRSYVYIGLGAIAAAVLLLVGLGMRARSGAALSDALAPSPAGAATPADTPEPKTEPSPYLFSGDMIETTAPAPAYTPEPVYTPDPAAAYDLARPGYVTSNQLLMRRTPEVDEDNVFGALRKGNVVDLLAKQGAFYYVRSPDLEMVGYVLSQYIRTDYDAQVPRVKSTAAPAYTNTPEPTPTPGILGGRPDDDYSYYQPTKPPFSLLTPAPD